MRTLGDPVSLLPDYENSPGLDRPAWIDIEGDFYYWIDGFKNSIWRTDGTEEGTSEIGIGDAYASTHVVPTESGLFFVTFGREGGIHWIGDEETSPTPVLPAPLSDIFIDDNLMFYVTDSELWFFDTTTREQHYVTDNMTAFEVNLVGFDHFGVIARIGRNYFYERDNELWGTDLEAHWPADLPFPASARITIEDGDTYYFGRDRRFKREERGLWASDGSRDGAYLVRNFLSGSRITVVGVSGSNAVFQIDDEVWMTDGTSAGTTRLLRGFERGRARALGNYVVAVSDLGKTLHIDLKTLQVREETHARAERDISLLPWIALDGPDGQILRRVSPSLTEAAVETPFDELHWHVSIPGGSVFFARTKAYGDEPWWFDDNTGEVRLITDIRPGEAGSTRLGGPSLFSPLNSRPIRMGERLLFFADDGVSGLELWSTDGSTTGTRMLADTSPYPGFLNEFPGHGEIWAVEYEDMYLSLMAPYIFGEVRWVTQGEPENTGESTTVQWDRPFRKPIEDGVFGPQSFSGIHDKNGVRLTPAGYAVGNHEVINGTAVITVRSPDGRRELWSSTGTTSGTIHLADIAHVSETISLGDEYVFVVSRSEVWRTDGTVAGTQLLGRNHRDSLPHFENEFVSALQFNDSIYIARNGIVTEVSSSDRLIGVLGNKVLVRDENSRVYSINDESELNSFSDATIRWLDGEVVTDDGFSFFKADSSLWRTDGTASGTFELAPIYWDATPLLTGDSRVIFQKPEIQGPDIWDVSVGVSDGTVDGTIDLVDGVGLRVATDFQNDRVVFETTDGSLWVTDGTSDNTLSLIAGSEDSTSVQYEWGIELANHIIGDRMILPRFTDDRVTIWSTDGTIDGTVQIAEPEGEFGGFVAVHNSSSFEDFVFFESHGRFDHTTELWVTNGTASGTRNLGPFFGGESIINGTQLFTAGNFGIHRYELSTAHNYANPVDTTGDRNVVPRDALVVINELNNRLISDPLTSVLLSDDYSHYLDVSNDGKISPIDALRVINFLNTQSAVQAASPRPLMPSGSDVASAVLYSTKIWGQASREPVTDDSSATCARKSVILRQAAVDLAFATLPASCF